MTNLARKVFFFLMISIIHFKVSGQTRYFTGPTTEESYDTSGVVIREVPQVSIFLLPQEDGGEVIRISSQGEVGNFQVVTRTTPGGWYCEGEDLIAMFKTSPNNLLYEVVLEFRGRRIVIKKSW